MSRTTFHLIFDVGYKRSSIFPNGSMQRLLIDTWYNDSSTNRRGMGSIRGMRHVNPPGARGQENRFRNSYYYCTVSTDRSHHTSQDLMNWTNLAFVTHHKDLWTSSKIGIAGIKKKIGASRQIYEQFGQKIRSVTHHHWPWTSVSVNYVRHASQGVNNRSKRYSILKKPAVWWLSRRFHLRTRLLNVASNDAQTARVQVAH